MVSRKKVSVIYQPSLSVYLSANFVHPFQRIPCYRLRDVHLAGRIPEMRPNPQRRPRGVHGAWEHYTPRAITKVKSSDYVHLPGGVSFVGTVPDARDPELAVEGLRRRLWRVIPDITHRAAQDIRMATFKLFEQVGPLTDADIPSVEHWLSLCQGWAAAVRERRLEEYLTLGLDQQITNFYLQTDEFTKVEMLTDFKAARGIYAGSDQTIVQTGPTLWAICGKLLCITKKYMRPEEVVSAMKKKLGGFGCFVCTDHTSWEAHIKARLARLTELTLYRLMTKSLTGGARFMMWIETMMTQIRHCSSFAFDAFVNCRMSGDYDTSVGNTIVNWCVMSAIAHRFGNDNLQGFVEGDDGIFGWVGRVPGADEFERITREYGVTLKAEFHTKLGECSFCQLFFDEESDDLVIDPIKALVKASNSLSPMAKGSDKLALELLRGKAYSSLALAPSCPMTSAWAEMVLRLTAGLNARYDRRDWYKANEILHLDLEHACSKPIPDSSRELVSKLFDVPVSEQMEFEMWCKNSTELREYQAPFIGYWLEKHIPAWHYWTITVSCHPVK